ncbi:hypothetical protein [Beggiatoa leptomitoformis]|nr:hypothetical protein [Beggiatoa leptomitoformis]
MSLTMGIIGLLLIGLLMGAGIVGYKMMMTVKSVAQTEDDEHLFI